MQIDQMVQKAVSVTAQHAAIINKVWAADLEVNLRRRAVLQQAVVEVTDLLGTSGDTVYVPTLPDIAAAATLTEGTDMVPIALTASTNVALVPVEVGTSVAISRKALDRIKYDGMSAIVDRLAYAFSLYLEGGIAALWNIVVPGTATKFSAVYPNAHTTANIVAGDTMSSKLILAAVAQLEFANNFPFPDGFWRLFINPQQYADLLVDADVRNDLRYGSPETMLHGEVGVLHNCRIIKSNNLVAGAEGASSLVPTRKALLFAPRAAAIAWKRRPEVMADPTVYDFGRRRQFGVTADLDIQPLNAPRALTVVSASVL
jgi:N4-gp56 family major capsid protein